MHSARWARTISLTVFPLMIESWKSMESGVRSQESVGPRGVEHGVEVGRPAVRAEEQHRGSGASGASELRRIALDGRECGSAGAAREQPVGHEELTARRHGLALGDQDDVVDDGLGHEWRDDARPDAGDMALLGSVSENDGPFGIDGNDPHPW